MDTTRKAKREAQELTLQYRSRQETLLGEELTEDKLFQLLIYFGKLQSSPEGADELHRRVNLFGECKRGAGETSAEYYAKLRHWLDRSISRKKSPLTIP